MAAAGNIQARHLLQNFGPVTYIQNDAPAIITACRRVWKSAYRTASPRRPVRKNKARYGAEEHAAPTTPVTQNSVPRRGTHYTRERPIRRAVRLTRICPVVERHDESCMPRQPEMVAGHSQNPYFRPSCMPRALAALTILPKPGVFSVVPGFP